jgi:hypothetical protein
MTQRTPAHAWKSSGIQAIAVLRGVRLSEELEIADVTPLFCCLVQVVLDVDDHIGQPRLSNRVASELCSRPQLGLA